MASPSGDFVWYELMTTDMPAAESFYDRVVGWESADGGMAGPQYTIFSAAGAPTAGLMTLPPSAREHGARPGWIGYVAVDDVDGFAARVTSAGGAIHRAPDDIAGVGRFAVVADPQGAAFVLFKPSSDSPPPPHAPSAPGRAGWRELHAADWQAAFAFYAGLFGWTKAEAIDMGPMGTYQLFAAGGVPVGGMMTKGESMPAPSWMYYFNVKEIEAAAARVRDAGGQVVHGPQEVPGGSWIINCLDPQSAMFALVAPPG